jgi:hypothetical protein
MGARKLSVSMPEEVARAAAEAAERDGVTLSAWLTRAVQDQLVTRVDWEAALRAADELVSESEARHGPITPDEQAWVDEVLADVRNSKRRRAG